MLACRPAVRSRAAVIASTFNATYNLARLFFFGYAHFRCSRTIDPDRAVTRPRLACGLTVGLPSSQRTSASVSHAPSPKTKKNTAYMGPENIKRGHPERSKTKNGGHPVRTHLPLSPASFASAIRTRSRQPSAERYRGPRGTGDGETPPSSMSVSHKLSTEVGIHAGAEWSFKPRPKIGARRYSSSRIPRYTSGNMPSNLQSK